MPVELTCHLRGSGQRAAGVRVMDPGRLLGGTDSSLRHCQPPRGQPQVSPSRRFVSDAFRCPRRLERLKRPKGMPGTHSKNDSDHTGSQPRSSVIVHLSSFIVRSLLIRRTESSCFKLSIVYRLSGILRSLRTLRTLRTLRPRVSTYPSHTRPSAADIADIATLQSLEHEHEHEHERPGGLAVSAEHRVIMIRGRRRRAARVGSGKAGRPGRKEDGWRRRIRDEGEHRVDADADVALRR